MKTLKLIVVFISLIMWLYGCAEAEKNKELQQPHPKNDGRHYGTVWNAIEWEYAVVEIDNCEYIILYGDQKGSIIHKANCKNLIHKVQ